MRRSRFARVLTLTLSLWLALFMSASERLLACPMHGAALSGIADAGGEGHRSAAAPNVSHQHGTPTPSAPTDHAGHNCSCPGPGCCPPALASLPGPGVPLSGLVARHTSAAIIAIERFETEPQHLLPFATAPPPAPLAPTAPLTV